MKNSKYNTQSGTESFKKKRRVLQREREIPIVMSLEMKKLMKNRKESSQRLGRKEEMIRVRRIKREMSL
jgi:hypothetical protein